MQTFYMIIGKDALYLYEKNGRNYNRQYIEGNPEFHYQLNNIKKDIEKLLEVLVEEYNLDNQSELTFVVVGNGNSVVTEVITKALDGHISDKRDMGFIMPEIIQKLYKDEIPLVKEYGVNFDGNNYRLMNGKLGMYDYHLLGYTLNEDKIMEYIG